MSTLIISDYDENGFASRLLTPHEEKEFRGILKKFHEKEGALAWAPFTIGFNDSKLVLANLIAARNWLNK